MMFQLYEGPAMERLSTMFSLLFINIRYWMGCVSGDCKRYQLRLHLWQIVVVLALLTTVAATLAIATTRQERHDEVAAT